MATTSSGRGGARSSGKAAASKAAAGTTSPRAPRARALDSVSSPEYPEGGEVGTAFINGATFNNKAVQYNVVDGKALFEGDIYLGPAEHVANGTRLAQGIVRAEDVQEAVVISGSQYRWPNGVVPYTIDPNMPDQQRVHDAIAHWEQNTVISFVLRTAANQNQYPNWVEFFQDNGCYSSVGMQGNGKQQISLGVGCDAGRAIHEIGHAVGLWHEQSREDRDSFVTIHWENIQAGKESNFNQHITDGDDVGNYDYGSIMHYERKAFSKNGLDTITPTNPANAAIGQRVALSAGDLAAVVSMYGPNQPTVFKKVIDDPRPKQIIDPPTGFKKVVDDPRPKQIIDPPGGIKKIVDDPRPKQVFDPTPQFKKVRDDAIVVGPQQPFPDPGPLRRVGLQQPGFAPFLLSTPHQADVGSAEFAAAAGADLAAASAAVDDARRNVVALQQALNGATSELAAAQENLAATVAAYQSLG